MPEAQTEVQATFTPREQRFIEYIVDGMDEHKAAALCGLGSKPDAGFKLARRRDIRAEVERKRAIIFVEYAHLRATARALTADKLDTELVKRVEKETGYAGVRALELAYRRIGVIREGEFIGETKPQEGQQSTHGTIYRSLGVTAVRRTQTLTEEVVHTQQIAAQEPEAPQLPPPQRTERPAIEILEY